MKGLRKGGRISSGFKSLYEPQSCAPLLGVSLATTSMEGACLTRMSLAEEYKGNFVGFGLF